VIRRALSVGAPLAAAVALLVASASGTRNPSAEGASLSLSASKTPVRINSTRAGEAVVEGANMAPGDAVKGRVRVGLRNGDADVTLSAAGLGSAPGPNAHALAHALRLRVSRIGGGRDLTVFEGRPADLDRLELGGDWRAGRDHHFRFAVSLRPTGSSQDNLQGARTSFRLLWRARPIAR